MHVCVFKDQGSGNYIYRCTECPWESTQSRSHWDMEKQRIEALEHRFGYLVAHVLNASCPNCGQKPMISRDGGMVDTSASNPDA